MPRSDVTIFRRKPDPQPADLRPEQRHLLWRRHVQCCRQASLTFTANQYLGDYYIVYHTPGASMAVGFYETNSIPPGGMILYLPLMVK